jgi:thiamine-monophosphate kinase
LGRRYRVGEESVISTSQPGATKPGPTTVGQLGEHEVIRQIIERLRPAEGRSTYPVVIGPGDDTAMVAVPDGRALLTTDVLVDHVHFRRDWSTPYDVGRKAAAQSLADIAAMGGRATAIVVGLACPPDLPVSWVLGLADGLREECDVVDATVVGGDVVRADTLVISVTALGELAGGEAVTRSGARVGDLVAVCGRLGWAAAGLAVLSRGFRSPKVLADAHRRPEPPYAAGPEAAKAGARAMCDVSDGLIADLGHVARASGVSISVDVDVFHIADPLQDAAAALGVDALLWVLTGGEDHALAATWPPDVRLPQGWLRCGEVVAAGPDGPRVLVGGEPYEGSGGWDHFSA